ncbi:hypothetical protein JOL79_09070 [Microbispora sp. RL4-1S]|uniref:histidine kinase n=1 Tax=Microbispora oryzae TaxID=2806554 RepID=A0A940WFU9_9ACTN|nr:histidine kinase [Microbispora oryzae]MBP2703958.1 hypothetical protein [Microbispora oryzae]
MGPGEIGDLLLAAAVLAFTIPVTLIDKSFSLWGPVPDPLEIVAGIVTAGTMLLRRRVAWPMLVASVVCACLTGQVVPLTLAAYSMTAENRVRRWPWAAGALTLVYAVVNYRSPYMDHNHYLCLVRGLTLVYLPALVGTWVWRYRSALKELQAAVRDREENAAWRERRRIAGELHDTVTHAVTAMALNAGMIPGAAGPGEVRRLTSAIEDKAVQALTELRELLTVLRRDEVPQSAEGVKGIARLVREAKENGLRVALTLDPGDRELPRQISHACFRVVQEGLNNVRKHAPGAQVRVTCETGADGVRVSVVNSPGDCHAAPPAHYVESGYGLAGLRERINLAGGTLKAEQIPDGGFLLGVRIPFAPHAS